MPSVIVYGGLGALGSAVVRTFKSHSWRVISVDLAASTEADTSVTITPTQPLTDQADHALEQIASALNGSKTDAILCVAGGWQGGNAGSKNFFKSVSMSISQSIESSTVAAGIAAKYLKQDGLLVLTGASAVNGAKGTPGMVGYGLAKAAVHQMVASLSMDGSGVAANVVGILPTTIDTPSNRAGMPNADFSSWTPTTDIADQLYAWAADSASCENGRLYTFVTEAGKTRIE
ncbi:hypothetical protein IWW45_001004 [Coemansia sp. RSA 485]|nr:hypothetical protein IWW45_001004 [Coemansia sp. RSA 485]KAJ2597655.1 hypothetical protein GGF39_002961 [Coemansia sp. RSA 1721]